MGAALGYVSSIGLGRIEVHNIALRNRLFAALQSVPKLRVISAPPGPLASPLLTYSLHLPNLSLPDETKERARKADERARPEPQPAETAQSPTVPAGEDGKGKGEAKVDIVLTDAAGKEVRRMKGPALLGVNRAAWDFGSQLYKQPRDRRPSGFRNEESGPQVAPGTYNVTVRFEGHEAKGTVQVLADPSAQQAPASARSAHQDALNRARQLHARTAAAVDRVIGARRDVDVVLAKLRQGGDDRDGREGDWGGKEREADRPLVRAGEKLKKDLIAAEKTLWIPPGTKGLQRDKDLSSRLDRLDEALSSTWTSPTPAQKALLEETERLVAKGVGEVDQLFAGEVAEFRGQVEKAGIGLFSAERPARTGKAGS